MPKKSEYHTKLGLLLKKNSHDTPDFLFFMISCHDAIDYTDRKLVNCMIDIQNVHEQFNFSMTAL